MARAPAFGGRGSTTCGQDGHQLAKLHRAWRRSGLLSSSRTQVRVHRAQPGREWWGFTCGSCSTGPILNSLRTQGASSSRIPLAVDTYRDSRSPAGRLSVEGLRIERAWPDLATIRGQRRPSPRIRVAGDVRDADGAGHGPHRPARRSSVSSARRRRSTSGAPSARQSGGRDRAERPP